MIFDSESSRHSFSDPEINRNIEKINCQAYKSLQLYLKPDVDEQIDFDHQVEHQLDQQIRTGQNRGRKKNPYLRNNLINETLHKMASFFSSNQHARNSVQPILDQQNLPYSSFENLIKEIVRNRNNSEKTLLKKYLAPEYDDQRFDIKRIFSREYMLYLQFTKPAVSRNFKKLRGQNWLYADLEGTKTFRLMMEDDKGCSSSDILKILRYDYL